jgi:hypothetical protein
LIYPPGWRAFKIAAMLDTPGDDIGWIIAIRVME